MIQMQKFIQKFGGVALFYRQDYEVEILNDLNIFPSNHIINVDELWVSTETDSGIKYNLGIM